MIPKPPREVEVKPVRAAVVWLAEAGVAPKPGTVSGAAVEAGAGPKLRVVVGWAEDVVVPKLKPEKCFE